MKRPAIAILLAVSLLAGGCGLLDDPSPNAARLVIRGDADKPVRLIVSSQFVSSVNEQGVTGVVIIKSDTIVTMLPYEKVFRIEDDQRFFVETARLETDLQRVTMQVFVDGRKLFDEAGALLTSLPYRFVYAFNQRTTQVIVII